MDKKGQGSDMNLFGLDTEAKIVESGVRNVFTPHRPVHQLELFFGRQDTVRKMIEHLNTPGQHALLYGDRGVGKSSLGNITTKILIKEILKVELFEKSCSSKDNYISIFRKPLESVGVEIDESSRTVSKSKGGNTELNIKVLKAGAKSEGSESITYKGVDLTPSNVAEFLCSTPGLLYIDEADQLNEDDKHSLAETIKLLSDCDSPFKILLVGIAETGAELRAGHISVERCLKETRLERMSPSEISELVTSGARKCGFDFSSEVVKAITELSSGYAHFAHLLALKCVEVAIEKDTKSIDRIILHSAVVEAVKDAEATLKRKYEEQVRSATTDMFKTVMYAAARIGSDREFTHKQWREMIEEISGESIRSQKLSSYIHRLVSNDESLLIQRVKQGVYRFIDPRMPSYIKLVNRHSG